VPDPGSDAPTRPFPRELLAGDTLSAARVLLGARLIREPAAGDPLPERRVGRIVEVEAYIGEDDRASHARFGPTDRNRVMFGPPGIAYVYLVYGHPCTNVVSGPDGYPAAILLRSVVPVAGAEAMRAARVARAIAYRRADRDNPDAARHRLARVADDRLALGPANLSAAFDITRGDNGLDLLDPASPWRIESRPETEPEPLFAATPRIGVDYAGPGWADRPWRLVEARRSSNA
jgi:DNA-3-methyladenine glycosylase